MRCFIITLKINIDKSADSTAESGAWTGVHVHSASSYPVKVGGFHWFDSVLHYVSIRANALDAITSVIWKIQRNWLRADLIHCRRRLFGAAEHFMALLLGYWGNNMVIRLDGWGLARPIFIGVSMEKEWSGQRCLGVSGLGYDSSASWVAGEIRPYVTGAHTHLAHYRYQKTLESAVVIPSFIRAQTHTDVSSTSGRGQRLPDASLCSKKACLCVSLFSSLYGCNIQYWFLRPTVVLSFFAQQ